MSQPLKPWYKVVTPRPDLREGKPLDAAEFAVHLDKVRLKSDSISKDYTDPKIFFEKTFLTKNMLELAGQMVRRLNGVTTETSAIFNLATQFGGGKTHSLTLLYHLCKHGPKSHGWAGVSQILAKSGQKQVPAGDAAIFVGNEFDSLTGRGGSDGTPLRKTPWGELAWQLDPVKGSKFALVAEHDAKGIAPGGDVLAQVLPDTPCLILLDELMNYISRNRKSGLSDQFYNFLHNLTEAVRGKTRTVLAVSIPASEMEMNAEDVGDYNRITKLLDRLGKALVMSADAETSEIIRRRLFEWNLDAVSAEGKVILDKDAQATCAEYAQWCIDHRSEIPGWFPVDAAQKTFQACYPFHPSLLSVFERKWRGLPKFQQTRGILRLLALWVSRAYKEGYEGAHRDSLIALGTAPLEESTFRTASFEQLGERNLETAVTTDIAGSIGAHAIRLDQEGTPEIKQARLHRKVATTIFFESNGGQGGKHEATGPEIRLAVGEPDVEIGNVATALDALTTACYYLTVERANYRFSMKENLNKRFSDRRATIQPPAVTDRVKKEIQALCSRNSYKLAPLFFPEKSIQISDRPALTFIVADMAQTMDQEKATLAFIDSIVRECGNSARTFKSAQVWLVADNPKLMREEATKLLAWEDIQAEADQLGYDEIQLNQLAENAKRAHRDLKEAIARAYKFVITLGKDNKLKPVDLGLVTSSSAASPVDLAIGRLQTDGDIEKAISSNFLTRNWPPALPEWSTKNLRDAFFASPQFPRLLIPDEIKETIARGVSNGQLAYVSKRGDGHYHPFYFQQALNSMEVEISDETYVIQVATAEAYRKKIETEGAGTPVAPVIPPSPMPVPILGGGSPVVPAGGGADPAPGGQVDFFTRLTWSGDVPPPMWMNFYTKVLSKHAADRNLKLKVSFEASPTAGISKEKIEETKSALRELGLDPTTLSSE